MIHVVLFSWPIHFPVFGGGSGVVGTAVVEAGAVVVDAGVDVEDVDAVGAVVGAVVGAAVGATVGADVLVLIEVGIITGNSFVLSSSVDSFLVGACTFTIGLIVVVLDFWSAFDSDVLVVSACNGFMSFLMSFSSPAVKIIHT